MKEQGVEDTFSRLLGWSVALSGTRLDPVPYWCVQAHLDTKFTADDLRAWWRSAVAHAAIADAMPAVIFRRKGEGWRVLLSGAAWNDPRPEDWDRFELACEFHPEGWAVVVLELIANAWRYPGAVNPEIIARTVGH